MPIFASVASCEPGATICSMSPAANVCDELKVNDPVLLAANAIVPIDEPFLLMVNVAVPVEDVDAFAEDPDNPAGSENALTTMNVKT